MQNLLPEITRERFLDSIKALKFRMEKQPEESKALDHFVKTVDFDALASPNTQIIYGRNGTGKTHLLKAFCEYSSSNFESSRILPIYLDFREIQLGPVLKEIPLTDLISRFYRLFFGIIIENLDRYSKEVITLSLLDRIFGSGSKTRRKQIDKSIERIQSLLSLDQIEETVEDFARKVEIDKKGVSKITGKSNASAKVSLTGIKASLESKVGISAEEIDQNRETIQLVYKGLAVIDYHAIRHELENIIEKCGANSIILLVDEWSSLELAIQPLLAEMIRKTVGLSNKIYLKVASLSFFTRMSAIIDPPQRIGFQAGIDISELVDLDQLLNYDLNPQAVKDFLTTVAYEHLCLDLTALRDHSVKEFEEYLCTELFDSENAYFEIVRASEGNPRDFLILLFSCIESLELKHEERISVKHAIQSAAKYFTKNKLPEIKNNPAANKLFNNIFSEVTKKTKKGKVKKQKGRKLFCVSTEKAESDDRIRELWHYRFIHLLNPSYIIMTKDDSVREYAVYSLDYGKLLSMKVHKKGQETVKLMSDLGEYFLGKLIGAGDLWRRFLEIPQVGGTLKKLVGTRLVADQGVEEANIEELQYLLEDQVIDELLETLTIKNDS